MLIVLISVIGESNLSPNDHFIYRFKMTVRKLTNEEFEQEVKPVLERVLCEVPIFGLLPGQDYQKRALLFPINFRLPKTEFSAVITAADAVGDTGFYLSLLERDERSGSVNDLYFSLLEAENYFGFSVRGIVSLLENVMFSPNGSWCIKFVVDEHAVIGGSSLFIDTLFNNLPKSAHEYLLDFLEDCRYEKETWGHSLDWLPPFLDYLYGQEQTNNLLIETGLNKLL